MIKKDDNIEIYQHYYQQYAPMLLHFAGKYVSSLFAEDIVHDVFLKVWDKQVFLLPEIEFKRILFMAVRNSCIDHLRRLNLEKEIIDERIVPLLLEELDFFHSADDFFMREDLMEFVMETVNQLPERKKEIFQLSYIQGLKAREIAEQLNLSTRTVENQLYRTLLYLRKHLSSQFVYLFILF